MSSRETVEPTKDKAPLESQSHSSVQSNVRKFDKACDYATEGRNEKGKKVICNFCQKMMCGDGKKGEVTSCKKVPPDVRFTMQGSLKEMEVKGKNVGGSVNILDESDEEEEEVQFQNKEKLQKEKRKATSQLHPIFTKGRNDHSQPTIKSAMQSKKRVHDVDLAIAMWLYDACIPMNACNSPYSQHTVDKIVDIGYGYKAPNYHALRVNLLSDAKKSVLLLIDSYRKEWIENGCTVMSDGWMDNRNRCLINFLVYCPKGISFIKSVDASDIQSTSVNLCNLFYEIVEMVGPKNVVQFITDNAANYKLVGNMLSERYSSITWSPCAAHCPNLVMQDISQLDHVKSLITLASRVTVFVYNHKWPISWLRKRTGWKEIIRPGATRFGTSFIALQSLHDRKEDLQAMVISNEWWKLFGGDYSKLQKYAIRILSQTASSSGCECNWSVFERMHTKRRNRFEHQRLNDLVYIHYNLRLQNRIKVDTRSYDLVDYEAIDEEMEKWVVKEAKEGELDYDELEEMLDAQVEESASQPQENESGYALVDEDDEEFRVLSDRELNAYNTPFSQ